MSIGCCLEWSLGLGRDCLCAFCCCGLWDYWGSECEHSSSEELEEQLPTASWREFTPSGGSELQPIYKKLGSHSDEAGEEEAPLPVYLDSHFDPDADYLKNFDSLGWHTEKRLQSMAVSSSLIDEMALTSEQALMSLDLTPRDITQNLDRLNSAIRMTKDPEKKASHIKRYELRKFDHDEDNLADRERAHFALEDARNFLNKPLARVHHYQVAIKFTNNVAAKEKIRAEYREYCFSLMK